MKKLFYILLFSSIPTLVFAGGIPPFPPNDYTTNGVSSSAAITANAIVCGDDGVKGIKECDGSNTITGDTIFPIDSDATTPTINFGGDTGIYEASTNTIGISNGGTYRWAITANALGSAENTGGRLKRSGASITVPYIYATVDDNTGVGGDATGDNDTLALVTGGMTALQMMESTSLITSVLTGKLSNTPQTVSVVDSGDGNPATATLTPVANQIQITCADANSCDITMSETGAANGHEITIVCLNDGAGAGKTCDFSDTGGVSELSGALSLDLYDTLKLVYVVDTWVQVSTSNN